MRKLVWLAAIFAGIATASPAHASSIFFPYSGYVSSDVSSGIPGFPFMISLPFGQDNLTGQSFSINETFNLNNADSILNGSYIGTLGNSSFASANITMGGVSLPYRSDFGTFTPTLGGFSSEMGTRGSPTFAFSSLNYSSTFTANGTVVDASYTQGTERTLV